VTTFPGPTSRGADPQARQAGDRLPLLLQPGPVARHLVRNSKGKRSGVRRQGRNIFRAIGFFCE